MLKPHNVWMKFSNVRKKKVKELPNVRKELLHVMLKLHNVRIEPSNVIKKSKGTTIFEKIIVICDIGITH